MEIRSYSKCAGPLMKLKGVTSIVTDEEVRIEMGDTVVGYTPDATVRIGSDPDDRVYDEGPQSAGLLNAVFDGVYNARTV